MQDYLEFSGYRIDYVVKKEKRRSYRLKIDRESRLIVYVPVWATNADIERVILSKKNWISKHITHRQSLKEAHPKLPEATYRDGCQHYFLGVPYPVKLIRSKENSVRLEDGLWKLSFTEKHFPPAQELAAQMFSMWYKKQADILFTDIFNKIKKDFSIPADDSVIIKNRFMKSRWGTCIIKGSQKTINLNTHLLQLPLHLTEYVMAHELSHLVHMNHSPAFYDYLGKRIPDWQKLKKETDVWLFKIRDYRT